MTSNVKHYTTYALLALTIITIGGYTLFQLRHIIEGPRLVILNPELNGAIDSAIFQIQGTTENVKRVEINDRLAFIDEAGKFNDVILLSEGYNVITVVGEDKFKRKTEQRIELVYKKGGETTVTTNNKPVASNSSKDHIKTN